MLTSSTDRIRNSDRNSFPPKSTGTISRRPSLCSMSCGIASTGRSTRDDEYDPNTSLHYHDGHAASTANALNELIYYPASLRELFAFRRRWDRLGRTRRRLFRARVCGGFYLRDFGRRRKVGEGSVKLAKLLGMDWSGEMNPRRPAEVAPRGRWRATRRACCTLLSPAHGNAMTTCGLAHARPRRGSGVGALRPLGRTFQSLTKTNP